MNLQGFCETQNKAELPGAGWEAHRASSGREFHSFVHCCELSLPGNTEKAGGAQHRPVKRLLWLPSPLPGLVGKVFFENPPALLPVWTSNSCSHVVAEWGC